MNLPFTCINTNKHLNVLNVSSLVPYSLFSNTFDRSPLYKIRGVKG